MCSEGKETTRRLASRNIRFIRAAFSIVKAIRITHILVNIRKRSTPSINFSFSFSSKTTGTSAAGILYHAPFYKSSEILLKDKNPVLPLRVQENYEFIFFPTMIRSLSQRSIHPDLPSDIPVTITQS